MSRLAIVAALCCAAACHKSTPAAPPTPAPVANTQGHQDGAALAIVVNGKPAATWSAADIARAGTVSLTNQNGQAREGWPLKALTKTLIGDKARVVAIDAGDERVAIDEKAWNDSSRTLVLQLSHRGAYKARWVEAGRSNEEAFLKGVDRIELVQ